MAKDAQKQKGRDAPAAVKRAGQRGTAGGAATADAHASGAEHHAAKAHGRPVVVDESLPSTRSELLALHAEARKRRAAASLGSEAFRAAVDELARIEVRIAAVDRAQDPPLG